MLRTTGFGSITVRATSEDEEASEWSKKDNRRFLRPVYRVTDLDRTIKYYTECFGMQLLERYDLPQKKSAVLGFGPQDSNFVLELIYATDGFGTFEIGTGFGHFGISTPDVNKYVEDIKAKGGVITHEPSSSGSIVNAFAQDPDGYFFELVERRSNQLRLSHVNLRVTDLDWSTQFYQQALGMTLLMEYLIPDAGTTLHLMGYSDELEAVQSYSELPTNYLELAYQTDGPDQYTNGNTYSHLSIGSDDVGKTAEAVNLVTQELGGNIAQQPEQTPRSTKVAFEDPDHWKTVFFENAEIVKEMAANQSNESLSK